MVILFKPEHIPMILSGQKTATRRRWSKWRVKEGGEYQCRTKLFDKSSTFAIIKVTKRYEQALRDITFEDALKEGYPTRQDYFDKWIEINGVCCLLRPLDEIVKVVEFELVKPVFNDPIIQSNPHLQSILIDEANRFGSS